MSDEMNRNQEAMESADQPDNTAGASRQTGKGGAGNTKRRWSSYVPLLLLALVLYIVSSCSNHPLEGKEAPDFELSPLGQSETVVSLSDHLGEDVVVLDFWASWCPPCRDGLPILDDIAQAYADEAVQIYAINIREPEDTVQDFVDSIDLQLDVLMDDYAETAAAYDVSSIPQTVIIGKDGQVRDIHIGVGMGFQSDIEKALDTLLAE